MESRLMHNKDKKTKRKRTASQWRNKRRRKREKRLIIESQLVHIPNDIVDDILSRLPVKSLMRFKAVCKRWRSTISNPNFHRREPAAESVFVKSLSNDNDLLLYSIDEKGAVVAFPVPWKNFRRSYKNFRRSYTRVRFSNSCNGMLLICLDESIFLFNPSTRYFVKVLQLDYLCDKENRFTIGFCYDESIGDYKAIILLGHWTYGTCVVVANLRGKRWNSVNFPSNFRYVTNGPTVNGRLHWTVSHSNHDGGNFFRPSNTIICFDPIYNVFEILPCPPPKSGVENAIVGLGILEGCLCMTRRNNTDDFKGDVEVLAMKEYGVAESWTTLFVLSDLEVNRYQGSLIPLLITKDGEILLQKNFNQIWRYNLAKKSYEKYNLPPINGWIDAVSLVENVVSPIGYSWDESEHWRFTDLPK